MLEWRSYLIRNVYIASRKEQDDLEFGPRGPDRLNPALLLSTRFSSRLGIGRSTLTFRAIRSLKGNAVTEVP